MNDIRGSVICLLGVVAVLAFIVVLSLGASQLEEYLK